MTSLPDLLGIPGRDAVASKGGYQYQDYATALAWLRLKPGELLRIETAEDYARQDEAGATLTQVRRVKASLTLLSALPFLDDVLEHIESNRGQDLSFVYLTTASVGKEKGKIFPPNQQGIDLWNAVKNGESPRVLIDGLKKLAAKGSRLAEFLAKHPAQEVVSQLIERVVWTVDAPAAKQIRYEAQEAFSKRVLSETGKAEQDARQRFPDLMDYVTSVSVLANSDERVLTHQGLNELIQNLFSVRLFYDEHERLRRHEAVVASLDPVHFDKEISQRTQQLRMLRFFEEADPQNLAKRLLQDIRHGGALQSGTSVIRATAMNWCARVLLELEPELGDRAVEEAAKLATVPLTPLVRALQIARHDRKAAVESIRAIESPESMTIRYAIERKESIEAALQWVVQAKLSPALFDQDGQFFALNDAMQLGQWYFVEQWLSKLSQPTEEYPVLGWSLAFALVAMSSAVESREIALSAVPVFRQVDLRDTELDFARRTRASNEFRRFSTWASANGVEQRGANALKYALWLDLSDPDRRIAAAAEIEERRLSEPNSFRWVALAAHAGSNLDTAELLEKLERRLSIYGSLTADGAEALLVVLMTSDPNKWIDRMDELIGALLEHYTPQALAEFGMKALFQAGRPESARQFVEQSPLTDESVRAHLLEWLDAKASGSDVLALEQRVKSEPTLLVRRQLIAAWRREGESDKAVSAAREVYTESQSHDDAEMVVSLLMEREDWAEVVQFFNSQTMVKVPDSLWQALRIAHFNLGNWSEALKIAEAHAKTPSALEEFRRQVALYSGHWDRLSPMIEQVQHEPDASAEDLLQWAHIAQVLDKGRAAKALTRRALAMPGSDTQRQFQGYMLAVKGNWQDDPEAVSWLIEATTNASDDGPVRRGSLKELVDSAPAWHEKMELISRETATGNLFQSLVAQAINQPLSALYTVVAHRNRNEPDPGQHRAIPAFAAIVRNEMIAAPKRVALDATALLTLADIDMLNPVLAGFDAIAMSHGTGAWLFNELEQAPHHQPSRVIDAKKRVSKFSRGDLKVLTRAPEFSRALAAEVGEEIPILISSAETSGLDEWVVVQIAPVHEPHSLGEKVADVSMCADKLRSLHCVAKSLHINGTISEGKLRDAERYLQRVDQGWGDESPLAPGCALVLTELALNYLEHTGLVEDCVRAGYTLWVDKDVREEAHAYESVEDVSQTAISRLDRVRELVALIGGDGKVFSLPRPRNRPQRDAVAQGAMPSPPQKGVEKSPQFDGSSVQLLQEMLGDLSAVDALVIDDRAANRYGMLTDGNGLQVRTLTTLDLLDVLKDTNGITADDWLYARSELRQAGYVFIPLAPEELLEALRTSSVGGGDLRESRFARAIRENHLLAQYSKLFAQPQETPWLASNNSAIRDVIINIWTGDVDAETAAAQSNWLLELARLDGFGSSLPGVVDQARWDHIDALRIWQFALPLTLPKQRREAYADWLERNYVAEMRARRPAVFSILVGMVKEQLKSIPALIASKESGISAEDLPSFRTLMVSQVVNDLPQSLRDEVMSDTELLDSIFIERQRGITLHLEGEPSVDGKSLYELSAKSLDEGKVQSIADSTGRKWSISADEEGQVWAREKDGKRSFQVHNAALFSTDHARREAYVRRIYKDHNLELNDVSFKAVATPDLDSLDAVEADLADTPHAFSSKLAEYLQTGSVSGAILMPASSKYFERLVGMPSLSSLTEFRAAFTPPSADDFGQIEEALLRSSHSSLVPLATIKAANQSDLKAWIEANLDGLDLWSLVGLIEGLFQRDDLIEVFEDTALQVVKLLVDLLQPDSERLQLQAALIGHVDGLLNTSQRFAGAPPFWRRLAAIAHAALIERELVRFQAPLEPFVKWAEQTMPRFQAAALCDLQIEPRWHGYLLQPAQLAQELVGRVMNVANAQRDRLEGTSLEPALFSPDEASIASLWKMAFAALPGPLEGGTESVPKLPDSLVSEAFATLDNFDQPIVERLLIAAHTTELGGAPSELLDGVVSLLRKLDATPVDILDSQMQQLVMTLSMAAADSRHVGLAAATQDFLIHRPHIPLALRLHAGLTACGAFADEGEWVGAVELLVRRMIAQGLDRGEAGHVLFVLRTMCETKWVLRAPLAASMARLEASSERL